MEFSKKMVIPAIVLMLLGVLVAVGPWTFAPVCEVHTAENPNGLWVITAANKTLPMPCGYTARAEIGIGAATVIVGGMMLFATAIGSIISLAAVGAMMGGATIALPAALTKTCALSSHTCNTLTAPFLWVMGIVLILFGAALIVYRKKLMK
ncbi:MAG: hypothetical protein A4E32_00632 [Methanomassiliicoccales archaeon PtaU1.Bin124]|nr:MAG: hypothetical protein A4E32_00632 [Methanomassiliicoccales archaeon PtaU1.Bin124]